MKTTSDMKSGCASRSKKSAKANECAKKTNSCAMATSNHSTSHSNSNEDSSMQVLNASMPPSNTPTNSSNKCISSNSPMRSQTTLVAKADVGWGNTLYIRGEGAGLRWDKGVPMQNKGTSEWVWQTNAMGSEANNITVKFLVNDQVWSSGENLTIQMGQQNIVEPSFGN